MKINLFISCALICFSSLTTIAQESLNSTGGDASGSGGSAGYSVGQVAFTYKTGIPGISNEGVQQPYEFFVVGINEVDDISLQLSVFPNPSDAVISLKFENSFTEKRYYQLYDAKGRKLLSREIKSVITLLPMQEFTPGTYLLNVYNNKNNLKSFTIIKNN